MAAGDEGAFTQAFHHYNRFIYPYVLRKVQSVEITKEIIQEAFLKLWIYRDALNKTTSPEAYLYRIVANLLQDHFRKQKRENKMLQAIRKRYEQANLGLTEKDVYYNETRQLYEKAVALLPPQRRHVYDLREEGFSYEEIADRLNISPNTVKNHLVKAGKTIQNFVKRKGLSALLWLLP